MLTASFLRCSKLSDSFDLCVTAWEAVGAWFLGWSCAPGKSSRIKWLMHTFAEDGVTACPVWPLGINRSDWKVHIFNFDMIL